MYHTSSIKAIKNSFIIYTKEENLRVGIIFLVFFFANSFLFCSFAHEFGRCKKTIGSNMFNRTFTNVFF